MSQQPLAAALAQLASSDSGRSETARLRDVLDQVEVALDAGVSRQAILDELHQRGFKMTLRGFETALYRLRQKRAKGTAKPASGATRAPAAPAPSHVIGSNSVASNKETVQSPEPEQTDSAPVEKLSNTGLKEKIEGFRPPDVFDQSTRPKIIGKRT